MKGTDYFISEEEFELILKDFSKKKKDSQIEALKLIYYGGIAVEEACKKASVGIRGLQAKLSRVTFTNT